MDGVLLTPGGYHRAVQDTVAYLGRRLGFAQVDFTIAHIHGFEAAGITNEWDTAAVCLAVMARAALAADPLFSIGLALEREMEAPNGLPQPDFQTVIDRLAGETERTMPAMERIRQVVPVDLRWIVEAAYDITGFSKPVQQEYVLGSEKFSRIYGLTPVLNVPSYLLAYDRSNLTDDLRKRLMDWTVLEGKGAAIFTNRPSIEPDPRLGTPEAELGAQVVGLTALPLAATGGIVWLEERYGRPENTFNKPHPVHALAAIRCAMGEPVLGAFKAAGKLVEERVFDEKWPSLNGGRVWVFEDAAGGLDSLRIAKAMLGEIGIEFEARLIGISNSDTKQRALAMAGGQVFTNLTDALNVLFESRAP